MHREDKSFTLKDIREEVDTFMFEVLPFLEKAKAKPTPKYKKVYKSLKPVKHLRTSTHNIIIVSQIKH